MSTGKIAQEEGERSRVIAEWRGRPVLALEKH